MALPPALLARLQKRGIVKTDEEEVFAESYDAQEEKPREENPAGAPGCPNKFNPHHVCSDYCYDHWREGTPESRLSESYLRRRRRMLAKYPLPEGWLEVYDAGIARHYYWNQDNDDVCWVSPRHPGAMITEPAPRVAKELARQNREDYREGGYASGRGGYERERDRGRDDRDRGDRYDSRRGRDRGDEYGGSRRKRRRSDDESDRDGSGSDDEFRGRMEEMPERDRLRRAKKKGIDPMDPAAYGDAPVGSWGSGLRAHDKTGADVTAGGPLFQQRPYPAPGAVLRAQGGRPPRDEDDEE